MSGASLLKYLRQGYKNSVLRGDIMCRSGQFFTTYLITLLLCIYTVYGFSYEPVVTEVPVGFVNDTGSKHLCLVCIECSDGSPAPDVSQLTLEKNESKSFFIEINAPGVYKYKLYRINDTVEDGKIKYDDTVYYIDITAASDEKTEKLLTQTTVTVNKGGKAESVVYRDRNYADNDDTNTDRISSEDSSHRNSGKSSLLATKTVTEITQTETKDTNIREERTEKITNDNIEDFSVSPFEDTAEITSDIIPDTDDPVPDAAPPQINKKDNNSVEEHGTDVKTGDTTHQGFWVAVMLTSFTVYALTFILEKKTKENNQG